jgi:hypothetical protein
LGITAICLGLASCSAGTANLGTAVHGVQLSIVSTNDVAVIGSTITITERVRNRSEDAIFIGSPATNSYVLTNQLANVYYLPPYYGSHVDETYNQWPKSIFAGETNEWTIRLTISEDVKPGDYQLIGVRSIIAETNHVYVSPGVIRVSGILSIVTEKKPVYTLISNSLKVKVVK